MTNIIYPVLIENESAAHYRAIIESAILRGWTRRKRPINTAEEHHICPRSWGGGNEMSNRVYLTYIEHFTAHKMLILASEGKQKSSMICALFKMCNGHSWQQEFMKKDGTEYAELRAAYAEVKRIQRTGKKNSPEATEKTRQANVGKVMSEASRKLISIANRGRLIGFVHTPEHNKAISDALTGVPRSREVVDRINKNPEKIAKTAAKHRGMKRSDENKKNMSDAAKSSFANGRVPVNKGVKGVSDATRAAMSLAKQNYVPWNNGVPCREETRRKLQEIVTRRWLDWYAEGGVGLIPKGWKPAIKTGVSVV